MSTYSEYLNAELSSAWTKDRFRMNTLHTTITSAMDLNPAFGDLSHGALSVNAHEYVHNLHNISTYAGLLILFNQLNLLYEFIKGTDTKGFYQQAPGSNVNANNIIELQRKLMGTESLPIPANRKRGECSFGKKSSTSNTFKIYDVEPVLKTFDIQISDKIKSKTGPMNLQVGYTFLTEGIAYEVDRGIRIKSGMWTEDTADLQTPYFPYLSYRDLVDHLLQRKSTAEERIILGIFGLQDTNLGYGFHQACMYVRNIGRTASLSDLCNMIAVQIRDSTPHIENIRKTTISRWKSIFKESDLEYGFDYYSKVLEYACNSRWKHPIPELELLNVKEKQEFEQIVSKLAPIWVFQQKPDPNNPDYYFFGNPAISEEGADAAMAVLQAVFHYIQHHINNSGLLYKTSDLSGVRCPYIGACAVRKETLDPSVCEDKPWMAETKKEISGVCYYAHAAGSLRVADTAANH